jgi:putative addiction module killer protein
LFAAGAALALLDAALRHDPPAAGALRAHLALKAAAAAAIGGGEPPSRLIACSRSATMSRMNVLVWSSRFETWFRGLADEQAQDRIVARLARIRLGNFGDVKAVGEGVSELRIDAGPGYRVYFVRRGAAVYVLLTGGDKGSQKRDIEAAKAMARELKEEDR